MYTIINDRKSCCTFFKMLRYTFSTSISQMHVDLYRERDKGIIYISLWVQNTDIDDNNQRRSMRHLMRVQIIRFYITVSTFLDTAKLNSCADFVPRIKNTIFPKYPIINAK